MWLKNAARKAVIMKRCTSTVDAHRDNVKQQRRRDMQVLFGNSQNKPIRELSDHFWEIGSQTCGNHDWLVSPDNG